MNLQGKEVAVLVILGIGSVISIALHGVLLFVIHTDVW